MEQKQKSWWSQRTTLEKSLTVITILGALLTIGLLTGVIILAVNNNNDDENDNNNNNNNTTEMNICVTKECIDTASRVLSQMDLSVKPCDNFYQFACGTFLEETVIPDEKTQVTSFSVIENQMKENLRIIINQPIDANEIAPFQIVKKLFQACMNTAMIEQRANTPISTLYDKLGGWPVVKGNSWDGTSWTWQKSVKDARESGYSVSYFFSFSVSTDNKDTTRRIIRIDQASLGLSREYLINKFDEVFVQAYQSYQVDLAVLFGADRVTAENEMKAVLEFEFELAEISLPREERRDAEKLYNPMTVNELQTKYPYNNWLEYFNNILPAESQLTLTDTIVVGAVSFFDKLGDLIGKTDKKVLANYALWRITAASTDMLPNNIRQRSQQYSKILTGQETENPRWLQCVDVSLGYFPHAFGALYVRKHFKENAKAIALDMVNNIKDEFKIMLTEIDWMDEETKKSADTKVNSMTEQIGFADELMNDEKLKEYYTDFPQSLNENEYFESINILNVASADRSYKRLRQAVNKDDWTSQVTPAIVNAFYSSIENSIKFPAGILQGVFFNAERPRFMNYGAIGFVIGHEITHGFDDQGSQYDAEGNLKNWWAEETRTKYLEKAKCIIDQYGNYVEPGTGLNLNGINTQGENIADNGGIKESYRAYNRWVGDDEKNLEKQLPGLNYTPNQLFWVSAAQVWCSVYRTEAMRNRITTGVHSPGQFRVIGPMSNLPEFSNDFKCEAGTPMNPAAKCEVW